VDFRYKLWLFVVISVLEVYVVWKLIQLPNTLVSVMNISDDSLFNAPPDEKMVADMAGEKFYYRIRSPYLDLFRRELDDNGVVNKENDWEKALYVARWVRTKLRDRAPLSPRKVYFSRNWSALDILKSKTTYRGLCDSYVKLFTIGCLSLDIPARSVWLSTHSVAEVFVQQRWVMVDPAYGFFAKLNGSPASCLAIRKSFQQGSSSAKWEPVVFDTSADDHTYRPGMEENFRQDFMGLLQIADANYSLQPPKWYNYFRIYRAINWVDENANPQGVWEHRLRWLVGINFFFLMVVVVFEIRKRIINK
jgi:hypothetical protein